MKLKINYLVPYHRLPFWVKMIVIYLRDWMDTADNPAQALQSINYYLDNKFTFIVRNTRRSGTMIKRVINNDVMTLLSSQDKPLCEISYE